MTVVRGVVRSLSVPLAILAVAAFRTSAHDPITTKVTWSREIAPIVTKSCVGCHRQGGPAPMSLASYDDARPWAKAMRAEVVSRRMPRWSPVRGFGHFSNDRSLSAFEVSLIKSWADGGAPEGDGGTVESLSRPATRFDERIRLSPRTAEPAGQEQVFDAVTASPADRWMTGWRFFANDPAIVQAEFSVAGGTYVGNWVPPEEEVRLPAEVGVFLPAGSVLRVTVWYRDASLQRDFPVGLPALPPVVALITRKTSPSRRLESRVFDCGETALDGNGEVIAVRPISARAGASLGVAVLPPAAPPIPVARIRDFDPSHLETYRLRDPAPVPAGSRVVIESESGQCRVLVEMPVPLSI
jgi:hypothetical protein